MDEQARRAEATQPATEYTREELDAAEPVRPPSTRRRWLLGLAIGALAWGLLDVVAPVLTLLCLPFALTPAGAGALVGAGLAWLVGLGWTIVLVVTGDLAASPILAGWWLAGLLSFVAGLLGTAVVLRRERARAA
jgi:hypothetical protein